MSSFNSSEEDVSPSLPNDSHESINQWIELMNQDIQYKIIETGEGESAEFGSTVRCTVDIHRFSLKDQEELPLDSVPIEIIRSSIFQIGEGDALPGLEIGLRYARLHSILHIKSSSRFCFGPTGRFIDKIESSSSNIKKENEISPIPADSDLYFIVKVHGILKENTIEGIFAQKYEEKMNYLIEKVQKVQETTFNFANKEIEIRQNKLNKKIIKEYNSFMHYLLTLQHISHRKEVGNRWFSYGDYSRASKAYSKATKISNDYFNTNKVEDDDEEGEKMNNEYEGLPLEVQEKMKEYNRGNELITNEFDFVIIQYYVQVLNNLAACKLISKNYVETKDLCVKVLEFTPFNMKALLRAAKACLLLKDFEECEKCLERILEADEIDDFKQQLLLDDEEEQNKYNLLNDIILEQEKYINIKEQEAAQAEDLDKEEIILDIESKKYDTEIKKLNQLIMSREKEEQKKDRLKDISNIPQNKKNAQIELNKLKKAKHDYIEKTKKMNENIKKNFFK